jgi:hypothetical protein
MTWSYLPQLLSTSSKDQVRLLIGDVISTCPQLADEEIVYFAGLRPSVYGAAAECCRALANRYARSVDQQAGTTKFAFSQMAKQYLQQAAYLDSKAAELGAGLPYCGGISVTDKQVQEMTADRVEPNFTIGMMDNSSPIPSSGPETLNDVRDPGTLP